MKKWLMLALLPLLLLAQQEAGATPVFCDPTKVGVCKSERKPDPTNPAYGSYTATFNFEDLQGNDNKPDYIGITIDFGAGVDLGLAKYLEQDHPNGRVLATDPLVRTDSLFRFRNLNDQDFALSIVILSNVVQGGTRYVVLGTIDVVQSPTPPPTPTFDLVNMEMKAEYLIKPGQDATTVFGNFTCMQTRGMVSDGVLCSDVREPITQVEAVPVANSFMLVGIGLMVLGIPRRRGKLSW